MPDRIFNRKMYSIVIKKRHNRSCSTWCEYYTFDPVHEILYLKNSEGWGNRAIDLTDKDFVSLDIYDKVNGFVNHVQTILSRRISA